jgi:hypothetical protein
MNVQTAQARQFQHPRRQQQPVRRDDDHIRVYRGQGLACALRVVGELAIHTQAARLLDTDALFVGIDFHRAGVKLHAASGGPIRLSEHQHNFEFSGPHTTQ